MRRLILFLITITLCSCYADVNVIMRSDNSAKVRQSYLESLPYPEYKQDSLGWYDTRVERNKYNTPIIADFEDFYGSYFSFDIVTIDSLPKYISGLPADFVEIKMFGDSLFLFKTNEIERKPERGGVITHSFVFNFPETVKNFAASRKSGWYWEPKKDSSRVVISVNPKKSWKKKRTDLIIVELK